VKRQKAIDSHISSTVPDASYIFESDDTLLVMGNPGKLIQLQDMM